MKSFVSTCLLAIALAGGILPSGICPGCIGCKVEAALLSHACSCCAKPSVPVSRCVGTPKSCCISQSPVIVHDSKSLAVNAGADAEPLTRQDATRISTALQGRANAAFHRPTHAPDTPLFLIARSILI